jgi:UDP-glucuronate decarboxylase
MTIRELADAVLDLTGSRSEILHKPLPMDDPRQRRPDISKAQKLLDWEPKVGLLEGLRRTVEYFDGLLSSDRAARRRVGEDVKEPQQV